MADLCEASIARAFKTVPGVEYNGTRSTASSNCKLRSRCRARFSPESSGTTVGSASRRRMASYALKPPIAPARQKHEP